MYSIPITKNSNQKFNTAIKGHRIDFQFRSFRGIIYVSIMIDREFVLCGTKAILGKKLLGKSEADLLGGNFVFSSIKDDYPDFNDFDGYTTRLLFVEN